VEAFRPRAAATDTFPARRQTYQDTYSTVLFDCDFKPGVRLKIARSEDVVAAFGGNACVLAVVAGFNEKANFNEKGELYCCCSGLSSRNKVRLFDRRRRGDLLRAKSSPFLGSQIFG
jgi:hypothetical protein